jgi:NAD(P)-dependent dehydrogenase (short-subunit alcohol dehydrogenase family)
MTTILVTGANRGIGLEFTRQYAADGDMVIACARHPENATALQALAASSGGKIMIHALDVTSGQSVADLHAALGNQPVDILINNAGVYGGDHQQFGKIDFAAWEATLNANTLGPLRMLEAFRPNLAASQQKKAVMITSAMGSTAGHSGNALIYRSSKAALNNAARGAAQVLAKEGITVVVMHPGWVRTDMGGPSATLAPEDAVTSMRKVVSRLQPSGNGEFLNYDGAIIPW